MTKKQQPRYKCQSSNYKFLSVQEKEKRGRKKKGSWKNFVVHQMPQRIQTL